MAAAISKPLLSDLVAQTGQVPSSHHIRPVGDRPDLANVDNESGAAIPLIDLKKLNGPERREVVEAIGRACESDGFFMVTNHGVPAPAGVVEGMLRVDGELFHFHLPESERLKCYSDDPNKAIRMSTSFNVRTEEVSNWRRDFLRLHCYPFESFVDQWPSNPPSSFRQVVGTYATEARALALRLLEAISESQSSRASYCLPITQTQAQPSRWLRRHPISISPARPTSFPAAASQPGPRGGESRFSPPPFILQKNDVKVEVMITDEATTDEDVSKLDLAIMAATFSLLVPTAINLDGLTSSWGTPWKEFYGIFLMISLVSTIIGLFTAASSRARSLSPSCARLGLVLATALFLLPIASKLGRFGCAAGVALAALVMLVLAVIWICGEQLTSRAAPGI